MTRPLRVNDRVRYCNFFGIVKSIDGQLVEVLFDTGLRTWKHIMSLSRAPFSCSLAEALAFVQTARETGAESIATPMRVLEALANAARGE